MNGENFIFFLFHFEMEKKLFTWLTVVHNVDPTCLHANLACAHASRVPYIVMPDAMIELTFVKSII